MNTEAILKVLHTQLAIEDPQAFGKAADDSHATVAAAPLMDLIDRIVDEVGQQVGDDSPEYESTVAVSTVLSQTANMLARAATVLWQSAYFKHKSYDRSPHLPATSPAQAKEAFQAYLAALTKLKDVIAGSGLDSGNTPVTTDVGNELDLVPDVFAFLSERRFQLRRLIHPNVCQYKGPIRYSETGADRGDEILVHFNIFVEGGDLAESPENWTLRDEPEILRRTLVSMLSDLRHLADASELNWKKVETDARIAYREELNEDRS